MEAAIETFYSTLFPRYEEKYARNVVPTHPYHNELGDQEQLLPEPFALEPDEWAFCQALDISLITQLLTSAIPPPLLALLTQFIASHIETHVKTPEALKVCLESGNIIVAIQ